MLSFIDVDNLPGEYGGHQPSLDEIIERWLWII